MKYKVIKSVTLQNGKHLKAGSFVSDDTVGENILTLDRATIKILLKRKSIKLLTTKL